MRIRHRTGLNVDVVRCKGIVMPVSITHIYDVSSERKPGICYRCTQPHLRVTHLYQQRIIIRHSSQLIECKKVGKLCSLLRYGSDNGNLSVAKACSRTYKVRFVLCALGGVLVFTFKCLLSSPDATLTY